MNTLAWLGTGNDSFSDELLFWTGLAFLIFVSIVVLFALVKTAGRNAKTLTYDKKWYKKLASAIVMVIALYIAGMILFTLI